MDVLPLEFSVFIDDVIQRVDVHIRTEAYQYVAHHFVDPDGPLYGGEAVGVDRVGYVKMEEVELLLELVERWLD